jgi:cytochrome c
LVFSALARCYPYLQEEEPVKLLILFLTLVLLACERQESPQIPSESVKELVGIRGCPYCHDMRRRILGPSFEEISERYSSEDREKLIKSILHGSRGRWGDRAMPPQRVSKEEARAIVEWILKLKHAE